MLGVMGIYWNRATMWGGCWGDNWVGIQMGTKGRLSIGRMDTAVKLNGQGTGKDKAVVKWKSEQGLLLDMAFVEESGSSEQLGEVDSRMLSAIRVGPVFLSEDADGVAHPRAWSRPVMQPRLTSGYSRTLTVAVQSKGVSVPIWWIAMGFIVAGGWVLWRRGKVRDEEGLCVQCGYDLRATPGRCPECGSEMGITKVASR